MWAAGESLVGWPKLVKFFFFFFFFWLLHVNQVLSGSSLSIKLFFEAVCVMLLAYVMQVEQFTNALQRQSAREEEGGEEEGGLPEAAEDLADEMAVAALSRTITSREDTSPGILKPHDSNHDTVLMTAKNAPHHMNKSSYHNQLHQDKRHQSNDIVECWVFEELVWCRMSLMF